MKYFFVLLALLTVFSCSTAQKSGEVQAARISIAPYLSMDCKSLATEQNSLLNQARSLGAQVDSEYDSDKGLEVVTWILFWPAVFWMDGNAEAAGQLSSLKGQLEAVQEAQKINKCTD
tara:strand:+ start:136 stop:489 length:354 start_codon:yes stop_codon:yes gene_type:complete